MYISEKHRSTVQQACFGTSMGPRVCVAQGYHHRTPIPASECDASYHLWGSFLMRKGPSGQQHSLTHASRPVVVFSEAIHGTPRNPAVDIAITWFVHVVTRAAGSSPSHLWPLVVMVFSRVRSHLGAEGHTWSIRTRPPKAANRDASSKVRV